MPYLRTGQWKSAPYFYFIINKPSIVTEPPGRPPNPPFFFNKKRLFRVFNKDRRGLNKACRGMEQSSVEPVFFLPVRCSTEIAVVWDKALRVFSEDLQLWSATASLFQTTVIIVQTTVIIIQTTVIIVQTTAIFNFKFWQSHTKCGICGCCM